jgi:hypothetical protein
MAKHNNNSNSNNNNSNSKAVDQIELAVSEARIQLQEKANRNKKIKAIKLEISAIELAIELAQKASNVKTTAEKEAVRIMFQPLIVAEQLQLEELTKIDNPFKEENMEAIGSGAGEAVAKVINNSPIKAGLSFLESFKSGLKK